MGQQFQFLPRRCIVNAQVVDRYAELVLQQARPAFRFINTPAESERIAQRKYSGIAYIRRLAKSEFIYTNLDRIFFEHRAGQRRRVAHWFTIEIAERTAGNCHIGFVQGEISLRRIIDLGVQFTDPDIFVKYPRLHDIERRSRRIDIHAVGDVKKNKADEHYSAKQA